MNENYVRFHFFNLPPRAMAHIESPSDSYSQPFKPTVQSLDGISSNQGNGMAIFSKSSNVGLNDSVFSTSGSILIEMMHNNYFHEDSITIFFRRIMKKKPQDLIK
jgi:hypothetical protein